MTKGDAGERYILSGDPVDFKDMNIEPTNAPINEDDHEPATKGDVRKSQEELAEIVGNAIAHESNKLLT